MCGECAARTDRSAAVIAGVAQYGHLPPLPAVANNRTRLGETLEDPALWGLPAERCYKVADPATSAELIDPVISAARQARDTLIVYYAGHGFVDHKGELFLTLPDSKHGWRHTAVPYDWLRQAILEHSGAQRRIVILDCCYSGRALEGTAEPATSLPAAASVNGTYLLTSAAENVQALSPEGEECTAFTGELTGVLREGVPDGEEFLTLDTVYGQILHSLRSKGRPEPQEQDRGRIGRMPFVRNRNRNGNGNSNGRHGEGSSQPRPSADENSAVMPPRRWHRPPHRHRRRYGVAAAGSVLLLSLGVSAAWLRPWDSDAATGPCSKRAALLDWSSELDGAVHEGQQVLGLSGLTVQDDSHVWALADAHARKLYRLSLGSEGVAKGVRVAGATTLKDEDGSKLPHAKFDGEAVALEKSGESVLVASETASSISRFDIGSGRLTGGVEVPGRFRREADGGEVRKKLGFESLAFSPDGESLYAATEGSLRRDDPGNGASLVRILRFERNTRDEYELTAQFAYSTGRGLGLVELVAAGKGGLLAVERGDTGERYTVRVHRISLRDAGLPDVSQRRSLREVPSEHFAEKTTLFDLSDCPDAGAGTGQKPPDPLVENVEGAALGSPLKKGEYKGRPVLYLVSDDNGKPDEPTRLYALAVDPD